MRILLEIISCQNAKYKLINNYIIQGFIYNLLRDTEFAWLHSYKGFKFFNFSNIFPVEDFKVDRKYKLIISSPNGKLIRTIYRKLKTHKEIKLGTLDFRISRIRRFDLKLRFPWNTATPIILKKGKIAYLSDGFTVFKVFSKNIEVFQEFKKEKLKINSEVKEIKIEDLKYLDKSRFRVIKVDDVYYSFKKGDNLFEWLSDLKQQSLLKYNVYTGYELYFEEPIFDELKFKREVAIKVRIKNRGEVVYIGTLWDTLNVLRKLDKSEKMFYKFLLDSGLGILNSMGFGFINIKK